MNTLSKFALGMMGKLRPEPVLGNAAAVISLPPPDRQSGLPLMQVLAQRQSSRNYKPDPLPLALLSSLLWAACGVNRGDGGRTAPSALNAQEINV